MNMLYDVHATDGRDSYGLITPHGDCFLDATDHTGVVNQYASRLHGMAHIALDGAEFADLARVAGGVYNPLAGFMNRDAYDSVLASCTLPDGLAWALPVTLAVTTEQARGLQSGEEIALYYQQRPVAVMELQDIYRWQPQLEQRQSACTALSIRERQKRNVDYLLGGRLLAFFADPQQRAQDLRALFRSRKWQSIAALGAPLPLLRTDEYLWKLALETYDGILFNPSAVDAQGTTAPIREQAAAILFERYLPGSRVIRHPLTFSLAHDTARAAVQQAIVNQNLGCDTLLLWPQTPPAVHDALMTARAHGLKVRVAQLEAAFHCDACSNIGTRKSCPHPAEQRLSLSDEEIWNKLKESQALPAPLLRPDVSRALSRGTADDARINGAGKGALLFPHAGEVSAGLRQTLLGHAAAVLWMTGLSGSGKSTIATRLEKELLMSGHQVYILDGDTLRTGLNKDLGFSKDHRAENLRRAAEVAKVIADGGLIVIASFISPFRAERQMARDIIKNNFYEVYVEANLDTCEARDPKGLYKRARAGVIPEFTGVSSPYEEPESPDIRIDTAVLSLDECVHHVLQKLASAGLLRASYRPVRRSPPMRVAAPVGSPHL